MYNKSMNIILHTGKMEFKEVSVPLLSPPITHSIVAGCTITRRIVNATGNEIWGVKHPDYSFTLFKPTLFEAELLAYEWPGH